MPRRSKDEAANLATHVMGWTAVELGEILSRAREYGVTDDHLVGLLRLIADGIEAKRKGPK